MSDSVDTFGILSVGTEIESSEEGEFPVWESDLNANEVENGIYSFYTVSILHKREHHIAQMPIAEDGGTECSIAYLARPTMTRVVTWMAEKVGEQPTVPNPFSSDDNEVLLRDTVGTMNIELMPSAQAPVYTIEGTYVYAVKDTDLANYHFPCIPPYNFSFSSEIVTGLVHGITDPEDSSEPSQATDEQGPGAESGTPASELELGQQIQAALDAGR